MIYEFYSNKPDCFKHIYFNNGMNIVLADGNDNLEENSRNGLGKTTLIKLIHFCLGAQKNDELLTNNLIDWSFTIVFDLFNEKIKATRSFKNSSIINVEGDFNEFPIKPDYSEEYCSYVFPLKIWKELLGKSLFGLKMEENLKIKPSFRMLISYFIRKDNKDFDNAFVTTSTLKQPIYSDICTCFFLGLNWRFISKYKELKDKSTNLIKDQSIMRDRYGSVGELRPELNRLKKDVKKQENQLENFEILDSYYDIEKAANNLTREIHELCRRYSLLKKKLDFYEKSIVIEDAANIDIEKIYNEAKFYFSDDIKKTLIDSKEFHKNIIVNRKKFLEMEINAVKNELNEISKLVKHKSKERSANLNILNNFGALQEYTNIQNIYINKKHELDEIEGIIERYNEITSEKQEIKVKVVEIEDKFQLDYIENKNHLDYLINLFSENSARLYDVPGDLVIDCVDKGFEFDIKIPKSKSIGKTKMMILCYDLLLLETFSENNCINFLIHDSNIFDGVDSRQYANSLNLINEKCIKQDMQYICMLNSDSVPENRLTFNLKDKVILKLSDESIEDSLLGFEFN